VAFDLVRVMRSLYRIDAYQETYFVIESFQQLFDATRPDFAPLYRELAALEDVPADAALPGDRVVPPGA
jgi:phenylalanine-4-hydroxylase